MGSYSADPGSVQRTEKTADQPSYHSPDEDKKSYHIISHLEIPAPYHCLKGTDRTGANSTWTGITVQARNTGIFQFACVNFACDKTGNMTVCNERPQCLNSVAWPLIDLHIFCILFLITFVIAVLFVTHDNLFSFHSYLIHRLIL